MDSYSKLGKAITSGIYEQYLQYKELKLRIQLDSEHKRDKHRVHKPKAKQARSQCLSRPASSQTSRSHQHKSNINVNVNVKQQYGIKRANSTEKKLMMIKAQQSTELNDPFFKIHIRRPSSASSQYLPVCMMKEKESSRYEQIKQYYQSKYEAKTVNNNNNYKEQAINREQQQFRINDEIMANHLQMSLNLNKINNNSNNNNNPRRNLYNKYCKH